MKLVGESVSVGFHPANDLVVSELFCFVIALRSFP